MKKMKKSFAFVIPLAVLAMAVFGVAAPFLARAQTSTPACPVGYTCTPVPTQPAGCPVGYICTPISSSNSYGGGSTSGGGGIGGVCYTFSNDLTIGSIGTDVVALQTWLIANGFNIPNISSGSAPKGYFGPNTAAALKQYQASIGIPATGYFGSLTRAAINGSCKTTTNSGPLTITNPTSSSVLQIGNTYNVTWTGWDQGVSDYAVYLVGGPLGSTGSIYLGDVRPNMTSFPWSLTPTQYAPNGFLSGGGYEIQLSGKGASGANSASFSIASSTNTQPTAAITSGSQTSSSDPVIYGTANGTSQVGVVLSNAGGKVYGSGLISVVNGAWSVNVSPTVAAGQYTVYVYGANNNLLTTGNLSVAASATGSSNSYSPSVTVLSPTNGESLQQGQQYTIRWSDSNLPTIDNVDGSTPVTFDIYIFNGNEQSNAYISNEPGMLIAAGLPITATSYTWTVQPNNGQYGYPVGTASFSQKIAKLFGISSANAASSQYTIQVVTVNGNPPTNGSSGVFTINPATITTSQPPVISGLSAPTTLTAGQQGTWTVNASDPQNGQLSYSVNWGDASACPAGYACANVASTPVTQSATFTHSYSAPGTYKVTFTVQDSASLTANTSATVQVTSGSSNSYSTTGIVSLDPSSPLISTVLATNITTGSYLGLPVLVFDIRASGGPAILKDLAVNISSPVDGSGGTLSEAYLYQGSTLVSSAAVQPSGVQFTNIPDNTPGDTIPANATVPYTIKVDITGVTNGPGFTVSGSVQSSGVTLLSASGGNAPVTVTGSANGSAITVVDSPQFSLIGTPTLVKSVSSQNNQNGNATDTYSATFNVQVQAFGSNVSLGLPNSPWPAFKASPTYFVVYQDGVPSSTVYPQAVAYSLPSNVTLSSDGTYFTVGLNQTVVIPVTVTFLVPNPGSNVYGVQMQGLQWFLVPGSPTLVNFMANNPSWRTSLVQSSVSTSYAALPSQADLTASIWNAIREWYASIGR